MVDDDTALGIQEALQGAFSIQLCQMQGKRGSTLLMPQC